METTSWPNFTVNFTDDGFNATNSSRYCDTHICECGYPIKNNVFHFICSGVLMILVSLFGILGNGISLVVLSRPQMKSSINYLLIGLARCDTMVDIFSIFLYAFPAVYRYTGHFYNYYFYVYPKIVRYMYPLALSAQMATVYLTLIVTMERYIAVCHPLKARSFCTYGRARLAVAMIFVVSGLFNVIRFWEVSIFTDIHWKYNETIYCVGASLLRDNRLYITIYTHWIYFIFYYSLPFVALVIFNMAIYKRVRKANRELQELSRHQRREIGLAMMLICVVIVFLICNILPLVSNIYENLYSVPPNWMIEMGNLLVTINSSINFIIYVIFGRKFKRLFLKLFCSARFFAPGRDSPEFQTNDESVVTNVIELRHSIKRNNTHKHRSSLANARTNSNGQFNSKQNSQKFLGRTTSPVTCVYYPRTNPNTSPSSLHEFRSYGALNGWHNSDTLESTAR